MVIANELYIGSGISGTIPTMVVNEARNTGRTRDTVASIAACCTV